MNIPMLCLVCLALLGWVVVLKTEIDGLTKVVAQLKAKLVQRLGVIKEEVEVTDARSLSPSELRDETP